MKLAYTFLTDFKLDIVGNKLKGYKKKVKPLNAKSVLRIHNKINVVI